MISSVVSIQQSGKQGYVYLVKMDMFKQHYKIGSTTNLQRRCRALNSLYGSIQLMMYGFSENRFSAERLIQSLLQEYNNKSILHDCIHNKKMRDVEILNMALLGGATSIEHFIFEDSKIRDVETAFNSVCATTHVLKNEYCGYWGNLC